LKAGRRKGLR
jgi:hypothetical protein